MAPAAVGVSPPRTVRPRRPLGAPQSSQRFLAEQNAVNKPGVNSKLEASELEGLQAKLLDFEVQLAVAKRNTWRFLTKLGFENDAALELLAGIFSGDIKVPFQMHQPNVPDSSAEAAPTRPGSQGAAGIHKHGPASSPTSSCGSSSPRPNAHGAQVARAQARPQLRPQARQHNPEPLRPCSRPDGNDAPPLDVTLGSKAPFCFSSTKECLAARLGAATTDPVAADASALKTARSPAPLTPRPVDSASHGLSLLEGTQPQQPRLPFKAWAAEYARGVAEGIPVASRLAPLPRQLKVTEAAQDVSGGDSSDDAAAAVTPAPSSQHLLSTPHRWAESQPPSTGLSPMAEPVRPVPYAEWVLQGLLAEPLVTTPKSSMPLLFVGVCSDPAEQQSLPPSSCRCLSTVSQTPQKVSFAEWCGLQQEHVNVDAAAEPSAAASLSPTPSAFMCYRGDDCMPCNNDSHNNEDSSLR